MPNYLTPGVYIEEVAAGSKPIEMVGTTTAAFLGVAPRSDRRVHEPFACNNWSQFCTEYVGESTESNDLARAVYSFFLNGGSRVYVVNVGAGGSILPSGGKRTGVAALETIDEIAMVAAPGMTDAADYDAILSHCEGLGDRFAILEAPRDVQNIDALKEVKTMTVSPVPATESGAGVARSPVRTPVKEALRARSSPRGYGAFYFPWPIMADPLNPSQRVAVPPSGFMAGIYARTDVTRGVHKAPANELLRGALGLSYQVTSSEQAELNRLGVNCIRFFSASGILAWGARTLDDSGEWRYINVRRLFNAIEESLLKGTNWAVFEPNGLMLWRMIEQQVSAFLTNQWRDGALLGNSPQEAFFVKCDAETNPPEVTDAGRLVIEVGIAPVKPAEFVVFRIGQAAIGGASVEEKGATN